MLNNFKLQSKTQKFNNIECYEDIDIKVLDKLLNSDLLQLTFSDKMRTKLYDNEKTHLLSYRQNYNKDTKQVKVVYKKSNKLPNIGRVLPHRSLGLHNIRRQIRHTLAKDKYIDVDIVCCHHQLLLQVCNKNNLKVPYLTYYVNNRENMLKDVMNEYKVSREQAKNLFIRLLYYGTFHKWAKDNKLINVKISKDLKLFYDEIKKIGEYIVNDNEDLFLIAQNNKDNYNDMGTTVSYYLQELECNILMEMFNYCKENNYVINNNGVLCADGIMIKIELYKPSLLEELNKHIKNKCNFDLVFKDKPMDEDYLNILDNHIINDENFDISNYDKIKKNFEENHFIIESPLLFGRTYKINNITEYTLYNKNDFKDIVKKNNFVYDKESISKEGKKSYTKKDLFDDWIRDPQARIYKNINFVPKTNLNEINNNLDYFNTFRGFTGEYLLEKQYNKLDNEDEIINIFKDHIGLLTNYDNDSINYLLNYISDLIQNPDKLPAVAIMFKSRQGYGKDLFLSIIEEFLGHSYIYRTANLDEIFGSFNTSVKDKLIIQLNELEGKDGYANKEKIKNFITEEYTNINEKKIKQYKQNNYVRLFIMSNNLSPIEIPHDDRRFVIFKATNKKPSQEYINKLVDILENKDKIKILYEYFKNFKITLNLRTDRPKTAAYKDIQDNCINPIYNFLNELFIKENFKDYFSKDEFKKHKKTGNILIQSNDFYQNYKQYLEHEDLSHIKTNYKLVKSLLSDIEIKKEQIKINGINNKYYIFNKNNIDEMLKHMELNKAIIEYDSDEFE